MAQVFSWKKKFDQGKAGEKLFLENMKINNEALKDSGVREYDFTTESGLKVELKTDMYVSNNFFVEYYSVADKEKPGSFWQSRGHGVDVFVYWFPNSSEVYIFKDLDKVCQYLEQYIETMNLTPIPVHNKGYVALGFKVPKEALASFYTKQSLSLSHDTFVKGV